MANVGDLKVLLTADDKASDKIKKSGSNIKTTLGNIGKSYAIMGGIAAGVFGASIRDFMKTGDELHKMALRTGIAVGALDRLVYMAGLSGSGAKDVENMLRRMTIAMNEARDGTMIGIEAFDKLGISFESVEGLAPEEAFLTILETLANMTSETEQVDAAMAVFGNRMGTSVIPMVAGGTEALHAMLEEARENAKMTQEQADKAAILTDDMMALKEMLQGVSIQMAEDLFPAMESIITGLQNLTKFLKFVADQLNINIPAAIAVTIVSINLLKATIAVLMKQVTLATFGLNIIIGGLALFGVWLATTENSIDKVKNKFREFANFLIEKIGMHIENFVNMFVRNINHLITVINKIAGHFGATLIPKLEEIKLKQMELTPVFDKVTGAVREQTHAFEALSEEETKAIELKFRTIDVLEDFTEAQSKSLDITTKQSKAVTDLGNAFKGLSTGGGGGFGGGGSAGVSMAAMMGAFPSLHSGQAQAEYNAALALMASSRKGAGDGPIDIAAERAKHGAFSNVGGMSGTTHSLNVTNINAITGSHVTKILSDGETRGLEF